jgi:hypothetical protein
MLKWCKHKSNFLSSHESNLRPCIHNTQVGMLMCEVDSFLPRADEIFGGIHSK